MAMLKPLLQRVNADPKTPGAEGRAQIENEYGFCPFNDKVYLRHLVDLARKALGPDAVLFTTDPPQVTEIGSLRGEEVLTCAPHPGCSNSGPNRKC